MVNVVETGKSLENINSHLSKLVDMNKRLDDKFDQLDSDLKIVTLDTQLHQAILSDVITSMKEFIQNFIPSLLSSIKSNEQLCYQSHNSISIVFTQP